MKCQKNKRGFFAGFFKKIFRFYYPINLKVMSVSHKTESPVEIVKKSFIFTRARKPENYPSLQTKFQNTPTENQSKFNLK